MANVTDVWANQSLTGASGATQTPTASSPWQNVRLGGSQSNAGGWDSVRLNAPSPSPLNGQKAISEQQSPDYWDESKDVFSNMLSSFTHRVSDVWHDSSSSFLGKVWDTANVPIVSTDQFERFAHFLGQDGEIPGWERGLFNLASGFTSPLQLGLTAGTFGTSALESGGAALLSKAGKSSEEIAQIAKGLPEYLKGLSLGRTGEELTAPLMKLGVNPDLVREGYGLLEKTGLHADALLQNHVVRRMASSMLRGVGGMGETAEGIISAEKWARAAQIGVDLGFTAPMVMGLTVTAPRFFDALKEGDYDKAQELAVESLGGAAFATLGAIALKNEAGSLANDLRAKAGLYVKPSEENLLAIRYSGIMDKDMQVAEQAKVNYVKEFREKNPDVPADDLFLSMNYMQAGLDERVLTERFNWLVQAMDKPELVIQAAETGVVPGTHAGQAADALRKAGMADVQVAMHSDENPTVAAENQIRHKGETLVQFSIPGIGRDGIDTTITRPARDVDTPEKITAVVNEKRKEFGMPPLPSTKLREAYANTDGGLVSSVLAASTPGKEPIEAVRFADDFLKQYKETGKFNVPETEEGNFKSIARRYAIENLQKVLDHVGGDEKKAVEWLTTEHPIEEVREVKGRGRINGKNGETVTGAYALGDAIGKRFLDIHNGNGKVYAEAAAEHFKPSPQPGSPEYEALKKQVDELQPKERKKIHPLRSEQVGGIKYVKPEEFLEAVGQHSPLSEADAAEVARLAEAYKKDPKLRNEIDPFRVSFGSVSGDLVGHGWSDRLKAIAAKEAGVEQIPVMTDLFDPNGKYIPMQATPIDAVKAERETWLARMQELVEQKSLKDKPDAYKEQLIKAFDPRRLSDTLRQVAKEQHDYFTETLEMAERGGALAHGVEWYAPQFWKSEEPNPSLNVLLHENHSGRFSISTSMARHRLFDSAFEGMMLGKELAHTDLSMLAAHNRAEFSKVIAARNFVERLRADNARGSDGRPFLAPEGTARVLEGDNGENPAVFVDPHHIPDMRIANKVIEGLQQKGQLDRLVRDGVIVSHNEALAETTLLKRLDQLQNQIDKAGDKVKPELVEKLNMMKAAWKAGTHEAKLAAIKEFNEKYKPTYLWATHDYRVIDVPAMKNWRWLVDAPGGDTVTVHTNMRVHPEVYDYLNRRLGGEKTWKNPVAKGALKATTEAKGVLLSIDTFHFFQEALRGLMSGFLPVYYKPDLRTNPFLRMGIEEGLTVYGETKGMQAFQDALEGHGHSKIMRKIPGLGQLIDGFQSFLFQKYIPGLKSRAFETMFDRYRAQYPEYSAREVARLTASDVNNRFGGQNYDRMGRSLNTMNLQRIFMLAPDWLGSEISFYKSLLSPEGKIARKDTALAVLGLWGVARVLNYMATGDGHYEAPFAIASKDDEGRTKLYSVRTLPTDALHLLQDPGGFVKGRVSPLVRTAAQTYYGVDDYGRKLPEHGKMLNLLEATAKNVSPIAFQQIIKKVSGEEPSGMTEADAVYKMAGGAVHPYRTEAQKMASEKASMMSSSGPIDRDHLKVHQFMLKLEDQIRSGEVPMTELNTLVETGQLSIKDAKDVQRRVQQTKTMDPDMARFIARVDRLPIKDLLEVWEAATPSEREAMTRGLIAKKNSYFKRSATEMTPEVRKNDPTLKKLAAMFPNDLRF
jgi:hypothetical protein